MKHNPPPINVTRARAMRRDPTDAERAMWLILRRDFAPWRFRRQVPIGPAIADFASHRARLVIEVDGGQHDPQADAARDAAIRAEGYRVVRFWNNDVLGNGDGVASAIARALAAAVPGGAPPSNLR